MLIIFKINYIFKEKTCLAYETTKKKLLPSFLLISTTRFHLLVGWYWEHLSTPSKITNLPKISVRENIRSREEIQNPLNAENR